MMEVMKTVEPDPNALKQLNSTTFSQDKYENEDAPQKRPTEITQLKEITEPKEIPKEEQERDSIMEKMTKYKNYSKNSMMEVMKTVAPDPNALKQLNSTTFSQDKPENLNQTKNVPLDIIEPVKLSNIKIQDESHVIDFLKKLGTESSNEKVTDVMMHWTVRVEPKTDEDDNTNEFVIHVVDNEDKSNKKQVFKNSADFLFLHAVISKILEDQQPDLLKEETYLGVSFQDQMKITGNLLFGAVNYKKEKAKMYQAKIFTDFLNSFFFYKIPIRTCQVMKKFLEVESDVSFQEESIISCLETNKNEKNDVIRSAMELELTQLDQYTSTLDDLLNTSNLIEEDGNYKNEDQEFCLLQNTLIQVMAERDEAHSQLVGASVFHAQQLEQERKKIEILEQKLQVVENLQVSNASAANIPNIIHKINQTMMHNSETELFSLCTQLSSEITAKTNLELEVTRLKEEFTTKENYLNQKKDNLQKQVSNLEQTLNEANETSLYWKECYEKLLAIHNM